jgi:hypothetical protein
VCSELISCLLHIELHCMKESRDKDRDSRGEMFCGAAGCTCTNHQHSTEIRKMLQDFILNIKLQNYRNN